MRPRALTRAAAVAAALALVPAGAALAQAAWRSGCATASATFAAAAQFPPLVAAIPSILGTAQAGAPLHATSGAFTPAATSVSIAWLRCDAAGASCAATGASGADYTPGLGDVGKTLRAELTPVNGAAAGTAVRSEPTPAVLGLNLGPVLQTPVAANTPAISGAAAVGQTLTAAPGSWLQLLSTTAYQWRRCDAIGAGCAPIAGATAQAYAPAAADRGRRLTVTVTVAVLGLLGTSASAETTAVVA